MRYGRLFEFRVVAVVDGTTAYEIWCRYEPDSVEIIDGCEQVIDSFRLTE